MVGRKSRQGWVGNYSGDPIAELAQI